jgi:hypothetical protein
MFPRPNPYSSILSITPSFHRFGTRTFSLGLFREKKKAPAADPPSSKSPVPSIHHPGTSGAFYPALKLHSAVSARPKREKRRLPLFPEEGEWTGILGDTAGDDAWVMGRYYLGNPLLNSFQKSWRGNDRRCGRSRGLEHKGKRKTWTMVAITHALLGIGM